MIIQPADRLKKVEAYYFARKLAEIDQMNKDGGPTIINLGIGSPDLLPPVSTIDKLKEANDENGAHKYQSYRGIPELRAAYAKWYKRHFDVSIDPDTEILPLIGSKEGIMHISMAFINPGDQVLVPDPGYPAYTAITNICQGETIKYNLKEENNWWPDLDALDAMDLRKVKIMWINYPHMPTGAQASMDLYDRLVAFAQKHQILLCHDNPYTFILNNSPLSLLQVKGAMEVCLELTSLSKNYNMAGWRIGALAGKKEYLDAVLKFKSNMDSGMFRPVQRAAVDALSQGQEWHDSLNKVYLQRRAKAWKIMDMLGCAYDKNSVGMFVWGRIPESAESGEAICDEHLYNARVFLTPGFIFGENGDRYVRISLCSDEPTLDQAIERINATIKARSV